MYRHDLPVLCFPSFSISSVMFVETYHKVYTVRSLLRGEKPVMGQSPSRPLAYL